MSDARKGLHKFMRIKSLNQHAIDYIYTQLKRLHDTQTDISNLIVELHKRIDKVEAAKNETI
jgi:hypothetical protein